MWFNFHWLVVSEAVSVCGANCLAVCVASWCCFCSLLDLCVSMKLLVKCLFGPHNPSLSLCLSLFFLLSPTCLWETLLDYQANFIAFHYFAYLHIEFVYVCKLKWFCLNENTYLFAYTRYYYRFNGCHMWLGSQLPHGNVNMLCKLLLNRSSVKCEALKCDI